MKKSLLEQCGGESVMLRGPSFMKRQPPRRSASPVAPGTVKDAATSPLPSQPTALSGSLDAPRDVIAATAAVTSAPASPVATTAALQRERTPVLQLQPTMLTTGPKLIPSPRQGETKLYTVVLDLDETVIYARDGPLYARSHLKDLLRTMHKYCEVIVWTAGERNYAKAIMKEINCENIIQHLVYRHRRWFDAKDYTKDLGMLGRNMDFVLIIENTPDCIRENPQNGIIVEDFEAITNEEMDKSTREEPTQSLGAHSKAGRDDAEADANPQLIADDANNGGNGSNMAPPLQTMQQQQLQQQQQQQSQGVPDSEEKPRRKRKAKDNTLLYLMEVIEGLGNSGGETVPRFLASCTLLKRQVVMCSDHGKSRELPIFYLPSKRRPPGSELKVVKLNRDRQAVEPIGHLPARLVSPGGTQQQQQSQPQATSSQLPLQPEKRKRGASATPPPPPLLMPPSPKSAAREKKPVTPQVMELVASSSVGKAEQQQEQPSSPHPRSPKSSAVPFPVADQAADGQASPSDLPQSDGDVLGKKRAKKESPK